MSEEDTEGHFLCSGCHINLVVIMLVASYYGYFPGFWNNILSDSFLLLL